MVLIPASVCRRPWDWPPCCYVRPCHLESPARNTPPVLTVSTDGDRKFRNWEVAMLESFNRKMEPLGWGVRVLVGANRVQRKVRKAAAVAVSLRIRVRAVWICRLSHGSLLGRGFGEGHLKQKRATSWDYWSPQPYLPLQNGAQKPESGGWMENVETSGVTAA